MADSVDNELPEPSAFVKLSEGLEEVLLQKIQAEDVSASTLNVVRLYLKDNGFVSRSLKEPRRGKIHDLEAEYEKRNGQGRDFPFPAGG